MGDPLVAGTMNFVKHDALEITIWPAYRIPDSCMSFDGLKDSIVDWSVTVGKIPFTKAMHTTGSLNRPMIASKSLYQALNIPVFHF